MNKDESEFGVIVYRGGEADIIGVNITFPREDRFFMLPFDGKLHAKNIENEVKLRLHAEVDKINIKEGKKWREWK